MTLTVLEKVMPEYFEGAIQAYYGSKFVINGRHQNPYKKPIKEETLNMIRSHFTHEIEFYDYCTQRLHNQYNQLFHSD